MFDSIDIEKNCNRVTNDLRRRFVRPKVLGSQENMEKNLLNRCLFCFEQYYKFSNSFSFAQLMKRATTVTVRASPIITKEVFQVIADSKLLYFKELNINEAEAFVRSFVFLK